MCLQVFELYTRCEHVDNTISPCSAARHDLLWSAENCKNYTIEECQDSVNMCGQGRYYCRFAHEAQELDEIHEHFGHAQKLVAWLRHQHSVAGSHLNQLHALFDQFNLSQRARLEHEQMLVAIQDYRAKLVQLTRANYLARQLSRKIRFAIAYFQVIVPAAFQQGLAPPSLIFPPDEPWTSPASAVELSFLFITDLNLQKAHVRAIKALDVATKLGGSHAMPISTVVTPEQDLGSLAATGWAKNPTLDSLPYGCWTGDRTAAISHLARCQIAHHREHSRLASSLIPAPAEPVRNRKRIKRKQTVCEDSSVSSDSRAALIEQATLDRPRRSGSSVQLAECSETKQKRSNSDSSDDKSLRLSYLDGNSSATSVERGVDEELHEKILQLATLSQDSALFSSISAAPGPLWASDFAVFDQNGSGHGTMSPLCFQPFGETSSIC